MLSDIALGFRILLRLLLVVLLSHVGIFLVLVAVLVYLVFWFPLFTLSSLAFLRSRLRWILYTFCFVALQLLGIF